MNFHVASRGVTFNFGFRAGGPCLNCSNKIILKNPRSLDFYKLNLLYLQRQSTKLCSFYFCKCKSYSVLAVLLLQLLSC